MSLEILEKKIVEWGKDRLIFEQSNTTSQSVKLMEEFTELLIAVKDNDIDAVCDAIGDMLVVQIMIAHMCGLDLDKCLGCAYNAIKDRKGKMVGGIFVKEK